MLPLIREFSGKLRWDVCETLRTCRRRKLLQNYYRALIQYSTSNNIFCRYPSYLPNLPALKGLTEILGIRDKICLHFIHHLSLTSIVSVMFSTNISLTSISEILHWALFVAFSENERISKEKLQDLACSTRWGTLSFYLTGRSRKNITGIQLNIPFWVLGSGRWQASRFCPYGLVILLESPLACNGTGKISIAECSCFLFILSASHSILYTRSLLRVVQCYSTLLLRVKWSLCGLADHTYHLESFEMWGGEIGRGIGCIPIQLVLNRLLISRHWPFPRQPEIIVHVYPQSFSKVCRAIQRLTADFQTSTTGSNLGIPWAICM